MSNPTTAPDEHFQVLAHLASSISLENLPASVIHEGRRILIDSIAAILAGVDQKPVRKLARQLSSDSIRPESTVLGTSYRCDAAWAALVNATAGVWHHLDPGNRFTGGHPAIHAVAAGLAVAESNQAQGKKMLEAIIAGYEIGARVGLATTLRPGMHPHGSWTVVGAAVTAGLLMGYGKNELIEVINLSTSLNLATSCQAAYEGATVLNTYAGISAAMGVLAATLKDCGFSAERDGISTVFGNIAGVFYDADKAIQDIGSRWEIEKGYHTLFGCDRRIQPALEALMGLVDQRELAVESVDWILVQTFSEASRINRISPENPWSAKLSIPHTLATYLVLAEPGLSADDETAFSDRNVQDLAKRIMVREDPELTLRTPSEWPARVTVKLRNGEELQNTVLLPSGEFDTEPLSDKDIIEKFRKLAPESITGQAVDQIVDLAWQIESVADIKQITRLLTVDG